MCAFLSISSFAGQLQLNGSGGRPRRRNISGEQHRFSEMEHVHTSDDENDEGEDEAEEKEDRPRSGNDVGNATIDDHVNATRTTLQD